MQARDKCLAISPKVGDGKSPAVRRFVHWVGHSHWMQHWPRADGLGWPRANDGRWPNASWARIQWMSGLSWIAVTSNEVYGLLWSKWPVDHPWSRMTNVRAFTSVPASRETRHRRVSQQDLLRSGGAQGGRIFWDHKEVFLHIGRGSRSWMTKRWRPHSSSSLQRNKTSFLSIKNCYLFLHRICWDQEEAKGTRSVEIRNWGRWRSR